MKYIALINNLHMKKMSLFDINTYVLEEVNKLSTNTLELYYDDTQLAYYETHVYEELIIPSQVDVFVSDFNIRRLVAPNTLKVIDLNPYVKTDFEYIILERFMTYSDSGTNSSPIVT